MIKGKSVERYLTNASKLAHITHKQWNIAFYLFHVYVPAFIIKYNIIIIILWKTVERGLANIVQIGRRYFIHYYTLYLLLQYSYRIKYMRIEKPLSKNTLSLLHAFILLRSPQYGIWGIKGNVKNNDIEKSQNTGAPKLYCSISLEKIPKLHKKFGTENCVFLLKICEQRSI